nr:hypothetical protein CPGR_00795 [Mycolicibacterium fortuitum subsp. fortuitum DSM 46621 = ATCC 6841 = JCM 6387]
MPIPTCQPTTGHIQLTHHTDRRRMQRRIQHKEAQVRQRHTDRAVTALSILSTDLPERGMHRRLGDAIHVDQPRRIRMAVHPRLKTLRLKSFPAEHHRLHLQLAACRGQQGINRLQCVERRRCLTQHSYLLGDQQGQQLFWSPRHRLRHHHQPATEQQRTPDLPHRIVKRQRMTLRPHLPRQTQLRIQRLQQPNHIGMRNRHTLRTPRRPRRIDQIRHIISRRHRQACTLFVVLT